MNGREDTLMDWEERSFELACERATVGLNPADQLELDSRVSAEELEELERVMACIHLAEVTLVDPPAQVMERLHRAAEVHSKDRAPASKKRSTGLAAGWFAAAATLVLALFLVEKPEPPASERRLALLENAEDLLELPWTQNPEWLEDPIQGEVLWSPARQEGYMRFSGLEPNDPEQEQFQLWVFDKQRQRWDEHPVDGGVFDITSKAEVIVPIRTRLPIAEAVLFAVTLERPGGVVVSQRERLILSAGR